MICKLCGEQFESITTTHLKYRHGVSIRDYSKIFPKARVSSFPVIPNLLERSDPRYIKWKKSLEKRPPVWNKGETKETNLSVKKISETMRRERIDNFAKWREEMVKLGKIKSEYPKFEKTKELAELIGMVLGDGNISKHTRTERLTIAFNAKYPRIIKRTRSLLTTVFEKKPTEAAITKFSPNSWRMWIYEKWISKRLGIPAGAKKNHQLRIPKWVWEDEKLLTHCLIGLYNAEGSYSIHLPTCTYNFSFTNTNQTLLWDVYRALKSLGYNPNLRKRAARLRRKLETERFAKLIRFRYYRSWKM